MIVISGQRLINTDWVTVSPANHPLRTFFFFFPIFFFSYFSLHFLRQVNSGSTIIVCPTRFWNSFQIISGKYNLTSAQKKQGCIKSYNGPVSSAFLGLLMFAAAEFLLILLFKQPEYFFAPVI
jgi:hypothetical protein